MINAAERASPASGNCSSSCTSRAFATRATASRASVSHRGEVAAKHRTAQAVKTAFEQGTRLLARAFCLKTVAGIAPLQRVVHRRQIAHAARKGPDMIQTRDKWMATGSRQAAKGGFQAINPAQDAGTRMEPLVSVPSEKCTSPAATAAAEPPDEPPAMRVRSCGLCVAP